MKHPDFRSTQFLRSVIEQAAARAAAPAAAAEPAAPTQIDSFKALLESYLKEATPAVLASAQSMARSATAGLTPRSAPEHARFETGTLLAWARLLLALERCVADAGDDNWMSHRSRELFAAAVNHAWDRSHDGLVAAFGHNDHGRIVVLDADKPLWVQAEAIAAAATLGARFADGGCWTWYDRLWAYCWRHHADEPDDSLMAACYAAIAALEA